MKLLAGKGMDIDWVRVLSAPEPLAHGTYAPDAATFTTSGKWEHGSTTMPTAAFAFGFQGSGATLAFPTSANAGEITLCLDASCRTEDLFSKKPGTRTLDVDGKAEGMHHIVVHKGPSRSLTLPIITIR